MMNEIDWHQYTSGDGKPFYVNKKTNKSVWKMPDEVKLVKQRLAEKRKERIQKGLPPEDQDLIQSLDALNSKG